MKNSVLRNKLGIRFVSVATAMMLVAGSLAGCGATAVNESNEISADVASVTEDEDSNALQSVMESQAGLTHSTSGNPSKEEVVYVLADANGNTNKVIVSDWLKNTKGEKTIADTSVLTDISNVSGNESFTQDADGNIVWDANGNDIHYQGTSTAELPVSVNITYKLDGKEITPEELAGKSGKVSIRFDYTNNEKKTVEIGGEEKEIYVPFTMMSGAILSNGHFNNIEVTNGRVISTGGDNIVVGMAFPGLSDSLRIDELKEKLEDKSGSDVLDDARIPDYVEITADAVDFQMDQTMTMAMSDVLSSLNFDKDLDIDTTDVNSSMDELADASNQLADGTSELYDGAGKLADGAKTLAEKSVELDDGAKKLKDGIGQVDSGVGTLKDGASQLDSGASKLAVGIGQVDNGVGTLKDGASELNNGAGKLADGIGQVDSGVSSLKDGADKLDTGVGTLKTGADSLANGTATLKAGMTSLNEKTPELLSGAQQLSGGLAQLESAVDANQDGLMQLQASASTLYGVINQLSASGADTDAILATYASTIGSLTNTKNTADAAAASCDIAYVQAVSARDSLGEDATEEQITAAQATVDNLAIAKEIAHNTADEAAQALEAAETQYTQLSDALNYGIYDAQQEAATLASGIKNGIDSVYSSTYGQDPSNPSVQLALHKLTHGAQALTAGVETLNAGVGQLEAGAASIDEGAQRLAGGAADLKTGSSQLASGAGTLKAGTSQLVSGAGDLKSGTAKLLDGAGTLKDGTSQLVTGAGDLKSGTSKLLDGAGTLKNGTSQLTDGANSLQSGTSQFVDGTKELYDGTLTLDEGTKTLMEGMFQFKDEGIDKLTELFGSDVDDVVDTLKAVMDAGSEYSSFTGANSDVESTVKFIYKTDAVK